MHESVTYVYPVRAQIKENRSVQIYTWIVYLTYINQVSYDSIIFDWFGLRPHIGAYLVIR